MRWSYCETLLSFFITIGARRKMFKKTIMALKTRITFLMHSGCVKILLQSFIWRNFWTGFAYIFCIFYNLVSCNDYIHRKPWYIEIDSANGNIVVGTHFTRIERLDISPYIVISFVAAFSSILIVVLNMSNWSSNKPSSSLAITFNDILPFKWKLQPPSW